MVKVVEKAKVAKEVEERTKIPNLGVNQAEYNCDSGLTNAVYSLWGCFTHELKMLAFVGQRCGPWRG